MGIGSPVPAGKARARCRSTLPAAALAAGVCSSPPMSSVPADRCSPASPADRVGGEEVVDAAVDRCPSSCDTRARASARRVGMLVVWRVVGRREYALSAMGGHPSPGPDTSPTPSVSTPSASRMRMIRPYLVAFPRSVRPSHMSGASSSPACARGQSKRRAPVSRPPSAVWRSLRLQSRTARDSAFLCPTSTASRRARVRAVYKSVRLRSTAWELTSGITTAGNSAPCALCTETAYACVRAYRLDDG